MYRTEQTDFIAQPKLSLGSSKTHNMAVYRWQRLKLTPAIDRFPTQRTDVVCRSTASSVANWITAWWWRTDATPMPHNISSIGQRLNNRQIARHHLHTVWNLLYRLRVIRIGLRVTRLFSTIATSYTVFLTCLTLSLHVKIKAILQLDLG